VRLFEHYKPEADLPVTKLSRYFISMVLHRTMLARECGVQESLKPEEIRQRALEATDDFLHAFCAKAKVD
jgi:hypothetical protein